MIYCFRLLMGASSTFENVVGRSSSDYGAKLMSGFDSFV